MAGENHGISDTPTESREETEAETAWEGTHRVVFGVEYVQIDLPGEGTLYVTRHGWPLRGALWPESWYRGQRFAQLGYRLPDATGAVYRFATATPRVGVELLLKFSRLGQEVPITISPGMDRWISEGELAQARFMGPFEEFGMLEELRAGRIGPRELRIRTKRPLAIYVPPEEYDPWQTGRSAAAFHDLEAQHAGSGVRLDERRDYILIYGWVKGFNLQQCYERGLVEREEFEASVPRVAEELEAKGFRMLDLKPLHIICRPRRKGGGLLRQRDGRLAYVLIDYELLVKRENSSSSFPHPSSEAR